MRKLTKTQRETIINECRTAPVREVYNGTEEENDKLISECTNQKGIPVFHIHESLERLERLVKQFDYIALGSSGEFWKIGTDKWFFRMNQLMKILCNSDGTPKIKIHMLRCLNPDIFTKFPFYSGDSSNLAQNHHERGAENIINSLKKYNSCSNYEFKNFHHQLNIYDLLA